MGWRMRKMHTTTSCSSFLFIPLLLLLVSVSPTTAAAPETVVSVRSTATASDAAAGTVKVEDWNPKLEEKGRRWWWDSSESECGLEDGETEEVLGMDSFTNQQLLAAANYQRGYITNPVLKPDAPLCQKRGNCRPSAVSPIPSTRCTGWCRRGYNPIGAASY